jgi:hypothetical protein
MKRAERIQARSEERVAIKASILKALRAVAILAYEAKCDLKPDDKERIASVFVNATFFGGLSIGVTFRRRKSYRRSIVHDYYTNFKNNVDALIAKIQWDYSKKIRELGVDVNTLTCEVAAPIEADDIVWAKEVAKEIGVTEAAGEYTIIIEKTMKCRLKVVVDGFNLDKVIESAVNRAKSYKNWVCDPDTVISAEDIKFKRKNVKSDFDAPVLSDGQYLGERISTAEPFDPIFGPNDTLCLENE